MNKISTAESSTGFSVSIKFRTNSVLLYRNGYSRGADGKSGNSTQKLLCSFSTKCTEIPTKFDEYLRQATVDKPERYAEILASIHARVLEPAKKKAQEQQFKAQEDRMRGGLSFASHQIESANSSVNREMLLANTEFQQILRKLVRNANSMMVKPKNAEGQDETSAEQEVLELLYSINNSCALLIKMMPFESKYFSRDYQFSEETIEQVRKMWFNASDANRALTVHEQLHRPKNWTEMRAQVMGQ